MGISWESFYDIYIEIERGLHGTASPWKYINRKWPYSLFIMPIIIIIRVWLIHNSSAFLQQENFRRSLHMKNTFKELKIIWINVDILIAQLWSHQLQLYKMDNFCFDILTIPGSIQSLPQSSGIITGWVQRTRWNFWDWSRIKIVQTSIYPLYLTVTPLLNFWNMYYAFKMSYLGRPHIIFYKHKEKHVFS